MEALSGVRTSEAKTPKDLRTFMLNESLVPDACHRSMMIATQRETRGFGPRIDGVLNVPASGFALKFLHNNSNRRNEHQAVLPDLMLLVVLAQMDVRVDGGVDW